jgi:hypothetical protein
MAVLTYLRAQPNRRDRRTNKGRNLCLRHHRPTRPNRPPVATDPTSNGTRRRIRYRRAIDLGRRVAPSPIRRRVSSACACFRERTQSALRTPARVHLLTGGADGITPNDAPQRRLSGRTGPRRSASLVGSAAYVTVPTRGRGVGCAHTSRFNFDMSDHASVLQRVAIR